MKIYPKCHPYWIDGEKVYKLKEIKLTSHSSPGYIMPCCICFRPAAKPELDKFGMFDEELKVQNVQRLENIFISKQWINFHRTLIEEPENAPEICKRNCGHKVEELISDDQ